MLLFSKKHIFNLLGAVGFDISQTIPGKMPYQRISSTFVDGNGSIEYTIAIDWESGAVDRYTDRGEAFIAVQPIRSKNLDELLKLTDECHGDYVYIYYNYGKGPVCYKDRVEVAIPTNRKAA